jgi:hypothetical protein
LFASTLVCLQAFWLTKLPTNNTTWQTVGLPQLYTTTYLLFPTTTYILTLKKRTGPLKWNLLLQRLLSILCLLRSMPNFGSN